MSKFITIETRSAYGVDRVYPICIDALYFAMIANTTTLTSSVLECIELLGYDVKDIADGEVIEYADLIVRQDEAVATLLKEEV